MYERTKFTAPSPTSSASNGQRACCSVTITLSTTARSISGIRTVMSVVPSDTANAA